MIVAVRLSRVNISGSTCSLRTNRISNSIGKRYKIHISILERTIKTWYWITSYHFNLSLLNATKITVTVRVIRVNMSGSSGPSRNIWISNSIKKRHKIYILILERTIETWYWMSSYHFNLLLLNATKMTVVFRVSRVNMFGSTCKYQTLLEKVQKAHFDT